ncbi:MAG: DUF222 domain-containing protein [Pseudonocardiaceae bacterium]|nr:DUF222 domain-containing protein [Pseudonocardiaceae bacterium]
MTATVTDPSQVMVDCLRQLRESIPGLSDREVTDRLQVVESWSRQSHALGLELVAEVEARNLAGQAGFGSTKRMLAGMLGLSQSEARARVAHSEAVAPRRALTGEELPPRCPATAAGLAAGEIGPGQLRIIAETMAAVPDSVSAADREWAEAHLAEWAPRLDPAALGRLGARVLAFLDPDGPEPAAEDTPAPSGALRLRDRPQRRGRVRGISRW